MSRKYKSPRRKRTIHVEYTRVFYEVLCYEEVQDVDIGKIFQTYLHVISSHRSTTNLDNPPKAATIEILVNKVLDELGV